MITEEMKILLKLIFSISSLFEPNTGALKIFNFAIFLKLASDVFNTHGQTVIFPKQII